jgi:two-component sensor histidine kinase
MNLVRTKMEQQKILLLDDDRFVLSGLGKELDRSGFSVTTVETGDEAVNLIARERFDGYIIDLVLDGTDGIEVVKRIKADDGEGVIFILTGYGDMDSAIEALRLGVDDYLQKPYDPAELCGRLSYRLERQKTENLMLQEKVRRLEAESERSRHEYETKLREIHHRVKNNFSLISALLNLQQSSVHHPADQFILKELNERINAFSLIHQMMYENSEYSEINIHSYLQELAARIIQGMAPSTIRVSSRFRIDPVLLPTEKALPLGLITTELVMNALEHGFGVMDLPAYHGEAETSAVGTSQAPEGPKDPALSVTFTRSSTPASEQTSEQDDPMYSLTVFNTGSPFPEALDIESAQSMGFQIVNSLTIQLGGTITVRRTEEGTEIEISFPVHFSVEKR